MVHRQTKLTFGKIGCPVGRIGSFAKFVNWDQLVILFTDLCNIVICLPVAAILFVDFGLSIPRKTETNAWDDH